MLLFSYSFHPHVTAVAHKRPWSFCQKCSWQITAVHAYTLDPMKSVSWLCCPSIVWELIRETSSQAPHRGTLVHSHVNLLSHCGLILGPWGVEFEHINLSRLKKRKKKKNGKKRDVCSRGMVCQICPIILARRVKAMLPHHTHKNHSQNLRLDKVTSKFLCPPPFLCVCVCVCVEVYRKQKF